MTIVKKQHETDNYYISLEINHKNEIDYYSVQVYPILGDRCGNPIYKMDYPITEKNKAYATFNRYKRKYK